MISSAQLVIEREPFLSVLLKTTISASVVIPLLWIVSKHIFTSRLPRIGIILIPTFYIFLFLINRIINILPTFPDEDKYRAAVTLSQNINDIGGSLLNFYYLNTPIRWFGGGVPLFIVLNVVMFVVGATLVWKASFRILERYPTSVEYAVFYFLLAIWPAGIVFNISVLREGQMLFFWGIAVYATVITTKYPKWLPGWLYLILGSFGVWYLREELVAAVIVFTIFTLLWHSRARIVQVLIAVIPTILVFRLVVFVAGVNYILDPTKLESVRKKQVASNPNSYANTVNWNSWIDILSDSPGMAVMFLSSPLTTTPNLFSRIIATVDGIFVVVILILAIWSTLRLMNTNALGWILSIFVLAFGFGLVEFSIGGAVRHRMPLVLNALPLAAIGIANFLNNRVVLQFERNDSLHNATH